MTTANITIPVDAELAEVYAAVPAEQKKKIQLLLNLRLRDLTSQRSRPLAVVMDELSDKAQARGLTPEILASILHEK